MPDDQHAAPPALRDSPATRATGDFDRRTFEVRARPRQPLLGLRPGMSAYAEWSR
ncbi:hypothetical protein ACVFYP_16400 [Roseomonas sp. F4]